MAIYPQNLHTHGTFGDGHHEYEETVKRAIELEFTSIGFSEHAYTPVDPEPGMTPETTVFYKKRIRELKKKYEGVIDVYCGIELDLYSQDDPDDYEYVIGDVHYIEKDGNYIVVDYSDPAVSVDNINKYYGGDGLKYAKAYYEEMCKIAEFKRCDIAGHFDLITKLTEKVFLFDVDSPEYKRYALDAVTAVSEKIKVFEINVGAIARGYRTVPYPAPFILKRIKELGCGVVISSDCHNKDYLDTNFDLGIELAKSCGFNELLLFNGKDFDGMKI